MQPCPNESVLSAFITTHRSGQYANWPSPSSLISLRAIAQLVEQRSPKPQVGGSRPSRPAQHYYTGQWQSGSAAW
jgi:hypothetical protein